MRYFLCIEYKTTCCLCENFHLPFSLTVTIAARSIKFCMKIDYKCFCKLCMKYC